MRDTALDGLLSSRALSSASVAMLISHGPRRAGLMRGVSIGALAVGLAIAGVLVGHDLVRVHAQPSEPPPPQKPTGLTGGTGVKPGVKPTPRRYALVIGVSHYLHPAIPPLRFAAQDAEAMYRFLTAQAGFKPENANLLTEANATLANMWHALDGLVRSSLPEDTVLIYFAGHGTAEVAGHSREADGLTKYVVPYDGTPGALLSTGFPMDSFEQVFAHLRSQRVVLMLDICWSGAIGGRTFQRVPLRGGTLGDHFLERLTSSRGRAVLAASGVNQNCVEPEDEGLRGGLFTHYLLRGMAGEADRDRNGIVTVRELHRFVEARVSLHARRLGGDQQPLLKGSEVDGDFPLVEVPPRTR